MQYKGDQFRNRGNIRNQGQKAGFDNYKLDYYDKDGRIKRDLFSDIAKGIVEKYFKKEEKGKKLTINQIRKFYDEVLNYSKIIEKAEKPEEEFLNQLPYIRMLKAKANVAYERNHINIEFKSFIEKNIDYIGEDYEKFKVFITFFEAIIAYSKGIIKD